MEIEIRKALPEDLLSIVRLVGDFAAFENLSSYFEITVEQLNEVLFGERQFVECLVAVDGSSIVAYALMYPNFSSFRGQKGMYLEDIYLTAAHRGTGLGERLLKESARLAREQGCVRLDFMVLDWNTPAIDFYERFGAVRDDDERHFKFVDDAFIKLSS
jgi:GNAT superfamily N-acetyltransferase